MKLTNRQRWFLCHVTRTNLWLSLNGCIQYSAVRETWRQLFRKLGLPSTLGRGKRVSALVRALRLGLIEIHDIDRALDERRVPDGWAAVRYEQVMEVMNENSRLDT